MEKNIFNSYSNDAGFKPFIGKNTLEDIVGKEDVKNYKVLREKEEMLVTSFFPFHRNVLQP